MTQIASNSLIILLGFVGAQLVGML